MQFYRGSIVLLATIAVVEAALSETSVASALISSNCNLDNATMPLISGLPAPSGMTPLHATIGRGTQNYTCDLASPASAPMAVGAIATLYDASCVATQYPDVFALLPDITLQFSTPANVSGPASPSGILSFFDTKILGHHYFSTTTTPVFDLNTPYAMFGEVVGMTANKVAAPLDAPKGQAQVSFGAVPWLKLVATNASTGPVQAVYRVNTAGGNPPTTCEGMPSSFTVEYAAEYWFWGASSSSVIQNATTTSASSTTLKASSTTSASSALFTGAAATSSTSVAAYLAGAASLLALMFRL